MYCLSQFCCLCFRNEVKLKLLRKITYGDAAFIETANVLIPEIQLSEVGHILSACEDCVNFVAEMHTFRQKCIENNFLLVKYIEMLGSFGGKIGIAHVPLLDCGKIKINMEDDENSNNIARNVKHNINHEERVENEDLEYGVSSDLTKLHCDETATSDNEVKEKEVEYKIEVNDDFNDRYDCKEEINNDDPLAVLFDDSVHSPELQARNVQHNINHEVIKLEDDIKIERVENEDLAYVVSSDQTKLHCDETATSDKDVKEEEVEYKIEVNDNFNDSYDCKEEINNDDPLEELLDDSVHSPELQGDDNSSNMSTSSSEDNGMDFMKYCERNTFYKCTMCKRSLATDESFKRHISNHIEKRRRNECKVCKKCFISSYDLKCHVRIHTGEKPHKCKVCGKRFRLPYLLTRHYGIHNGKRPHKCDRCEKSFQRAAHLRAHETLHFGSKPHKCDMCGKSFHDVSNMKRHKSTHFDSEPHKCDVCDKSFRYATYLKRHKGTHSFNEPRKCDMCDETFLLASHLKRHRTIHFEPRTCDVCGKSFSNASNLKRHETIHFDIKPHRCDVCDKSFSDASNLKRHVAIHFNHDNRDSRHKLLG